MRQNIRIKPANSLSETSDESLMCLFQDGSIQAFDTLVERYSSRLYNFLYRLIGDENLCEDLVQETYLRVFRNRHSYKNIAKVSTWMYTIARNLAFSEYRKRRIRSVRSLREVSRDLEEYIVDVPDYSLSPEEDTDKHLHANLFNSALERLPDCFREVVVLCDIQELSYEEISEITGLPMGTVKSRIHRGRVSLQKILKSVYTMENEA